MPPQHVDMKSIFNEVEGHNQFFDDLVDMIPAKLYVVNEGGDQSPAFNSKYQKAQGKDSRDGNKFKSKAEKMKKRFDPNQQESTRDAKKRLEQEADDDSDDGSMADIQFEDNHEEEDEVEVTKGAPPSSGKGTKSGSTISHQSRIEELKAKLRAKLEERKTSSVTNSTNNNVVSKRAARRAEKKRKIELAKKKHAQQKVSAGTTVTGRNGLATIKIVKDLGGSKINTTKKPADVMDDLAGIDFGGIAGLKDDLLSKGKYSAVNKSLKNMGKKKSLERLLEEAEAKKARLRQLKESDAIEDKEKAKKMEWGDALKAASGENTRQSDPALLKKALKRKAKKKAKSQEAWRMRMEQTRDKMDERQSIRNHNIKQRALGGAAGANLSRKRIKDAEGDDDVEGSTRIGGDKKKRPRLGPYAGKGRAGFEGKKQDFINNKGNGKKDIKSQ